MAQFMVVLDATVVNVALPSIKKGLHFSNADLQWIVNGYTLTFGGFLLLGGRAGDLFGRQRIFLIGLAIFSSASLFNGLATSPTMLIVGRAIQGFGGALISPAALSIITSTFVEGAPRTKALGVWSAIAASGAAFGLLIGGALTQWVGWNWAFYVNVPIGIVAFILSWRLVPNSRVHGQRGVDVAGAVFVTAGLMSVVYALAHVARPQPDAAKTVAENAAVAATYGWTSPTMLLFSGVGICLLVAFYFREKTFRSPLVRMSIFRTRSLTIANLTMFLVAGGMFAMFLFLSLYLQNVLFYTPIRAGVAFLPVCLGIGIGAGVAQQAIKRMDIRAVTLGGLIIAAAGFLLLTRIDIVENYLAVVLPALMVMSIGMGLTFVPITLIATTAVSNDDAGLASGLLNTSQQIGGALGLAILFTFAINRTNDFLGGLHHRPSTAEISYGFVQGYRLAFLWGMGLLFLGAMLVALFLKKADVADIATGAQPDEEAA